MEKLGFHQVGNNPAPGYPTINHNRPLAPQPPPRHFRAELVVLNSPSNALSLTNQVVVNPNDFPQLQDGTPLLLGGHYVYSLVKSVEIPQGCIGMAGNVRAWGHFSNDHTVVVEPFVSNTDAKYLGAISLAVEFRSQSRSHSNPIKTEDFGLLFVSRFQNQVLLPTQPILMEYQGVIFTVTVSGTQVIDLDRLSKAASGNFSEDPSARGILLPQTELVFSSSGVNLVFPKGAKSSMNRPRANPIINPDFKLENMGIGGLDQEFQQIFRRAFASRIISPDLVDRLGLRHVKGLLLFGPPGTGKTLIARQIGKMLNVKEPKIVNGPEMLSKYVGSSEENIRNLFKDAEAEYKSKGENSQLHIIIFDELDSVFKQRGGGKSDGTGVGDNVVNQLLAKMDGVDQLNNILIIGMTNRLDLIDNALLRPGRFEIQIEIALPDEKGRKDILLIHTKKMLENDILGADVNFDELAALTKNFTGAELEGLCNSATSFAINKFTKAENLAKVDENISKMKLVRNDFLLALDEVKPAFGVNEEDLKSSAPYGIIPYNRRVDEVFHKLQSYVEEVKNSDTERLISILIHGETGVGKTAIASSLALQSEFPFIKMLSAESLVGMSEQGKISSIDNIFRDIYRSPLNVLVIDKIETLINYVPIGPRFSNDILQMLIVNLNKKPPNGRRLLIVGTTSQYSILKHMNLVENFTKTVELKKITDIKELHTVMEKLQFMDAGLRQHISEQLARIGDGKINLGIKRLIQVLMNSKYLKTDVDGVVENILEAQVN